MITTTTSIHSLIRVLLLPSVVIRSIVFAAVLFVWFCTIGSSTAQVKELNIYDIENIDSLKSFFRYTEDRIPLVCGHRGGATTGYPEHAIATFEYTLMHTPAFFEVDPRLTKDSVVVLMHDAKLERTTNGSGMLSDYTWDEIKKLKLKDPDGNITDFGVHTLDEVVKWSKGKTVLMIDKKDVPLQMILNIINENKAESHVLISSYKPEEAKFYHERNKDIMFEAFIKNKAQMQAYEELGIPWENIVAYLGQPKDKELYDELREKGVMCIIYTAPVYEKIKDKDFRVKTYRDIINSGTDILLSDKVIEAADAIIKLRPQTSTKERFFKKIIVEQ